MTPEEQNRQQFHDVSRPGHRGPTPTSRPVIVGHRPTMPDPMLHERPMHHQPEVPTSAPARPPGPPMPIDGFSLPPKHHPQPTQPVAPAHSNHYMPEPMALESEPLIPTHHHQPTPQHHHQPMPDTNDHIPQASDGLSETKKHRSVMWPIIIVLLVILIGLYLLIDSGVIHTSIEMPFHLFRQETPPVYTPSN